MQVQPCQRAVNPSAWLSAHISKKKKAGDKLLLLSFQCFTLSGISITKLCIMYELKAE